jgi:hypothetical protein
MYGPLDRPEPFVGRSVYPSRPFPPASNHGHPIGTERLEEQRRQVLRSCHGIWHRTYLSSTYGFWYADLIIPLNPLGNWFEVPFPPEVGKQGPICMSLRIPQLEAALLFRVHLTIIDPDTTFTYHIVKAENDPFAYSVSLAARALGNPGFVIRHHDHDAVSEFGPDVSDMREFNPRSFSLEEEDFLIIVGLHLLVTCHYYLD